MSKMLLNETPVRTSKNYNINNIQINDVNIPKQFKKFESVQVSECGAKIDITSQIDCLDLKYGISDFHTKQVAQKANYKANVVIDSKTEKKINFDFSFNEENKNLVDAINIVANENTKSTVIIKYSSKDKVEAYHNGIIKAWAKDDSVINIVVVNFLNDISNNFLAIQNCLGNNAKINFTIVDFGGKNTITNYYSDIEGKNANSRLNTIYLGKENQVIDLNYIGELYGEKSNVNIEVQGALKDCSKKHFKGTIDFKKGCKKATGNENENCILLSNEAKSLALPMLLCSEEDVEGNHSTSSGKIAEKELFYIMSRGFKLKEAMKLMVRAKFNKILEEIKDDELKAEILEQIDKRID